MEAKDPALEKIIDLGNARNKIFTILNKSKIPIAPYVRVPTPTSFKTKLAEQKYWGDQESVRWVEGYGNKETGSYITGFYYHYMQEQVLKDRYEGGGVFRPTYRLQDHLVTNQFEQSQKKGRHTIWFKGKGAGASGIAGAYLNYNMRVNPGTKGLYTSNSQDSIASFFTEKVMIPFNNYHPSIKPIEVQKSESASRVYLRAGINFIDKEGNDKYDESILIMRETSQTPKSPKNLSGHGGKVLIIDEAMIHPRREAVIKSAIENLRNSGTGLYTGWALTCGTIEDDMTDEQLGGIYTMVLESEKYKFDMIFTPVWMIRNLVNGFPNKEKEIRAWEKELATKGKGTGAERSYRMINPVSVTDILDVAKSARWDGDVGDIVKQHTQDMLASPTHEDKVKLINMGNSIVSQPHLKGNVSIIEHPKPGVEYYYVFDGTVTGTEVGAKAGSDYSGQIIKGFDPDSLIDPNCFSYGLVCEYLERPPNLEYAYRMAENQIRYYDQHKKVSNGKKTAGIISIFGEANNNAESFISFMKKAGLVDLIGHRQDLYNRGNTDTKKLLQQVGDKERAWQYVQMNSYIRKHYKSIRMRSLIADMNKPPGENADSLDAFLTWFFLFPAGEYDKPPKEKKERPKREVRIFNPSTGKFEFRTV